MAASARGRRNWKRPKKRSLAPDSSVWNNVSITVWDKALAQCFQSHKDLLSGPHATFDWSRVHCVEFQLPKDPIYFVCKSPTLFPPSPPQKLSLDWRLRRRNRDGLSDDFGDSVNDLIVYVCDWKGDDLSSTTIRTHVAPLFFDPIISYIYHHSHLNTNRSEIQRLTFDAKLRSIRALWQMRWGVKFLEFWNFHLCMMWHKRKLVLVAFQVSKVHQPFSIRWEQNNINPCLSILASKSRSIVSKYAPPCFLGNAHNLNKVHNACEQKPLAHQQVFDSSFPPFNRSKL